MAAVGSAQPSPHGAGDGQCPEPQMDRAMTELLLKGSKLREPQVSEVPGNDDSLDFFSLLRRVAEGCL